MLNPSFLIQLLPKFIRLFYRSSISQGQFPLITRSRVLLYYHIVLH